MSFAKWGLLSKLFGLCFDNLPVNFEFVIPRDIGVKGPFGIAFAYCTLLSAEILPPAWRAIEGENN